MYQVYQDWGKDKDKIALVELDSIIQRLSYLARAAQKALGRERPIVAASEIEIIKDHLDLVVKYSKL